MPEFQCGQSMISQTIGNVPASTTGTVITGDGSSNVKGAWTELTATTLFTAQHVMVQFGYTDGDMLIDIGIGGSGSEVVVVENLYARFKATGTSFAPYSFPLFIPAGSRIAARMQSSTAGTTVQVVMTLFPMTLYGVQAPSKIYAYGADTATSLGTNIDPGGTAHTESSWVEMTAATAHPHSFLMTSGRFGDNVISAVTSWLVDVGVGAGGSEQAIVNDLFFTASTVMDNPLDTVRTFPMYIPSGTRISGRVQSSVTTDTDRDIYLIVYGG